MNYESLLYKRMIRYDNYSERHYLVRVYTVCEVPGMIDISVWYSEPKKEDLKIYQFYLFIHKIRNIPQFKRFIRPIQDAIHIGIEVSLMMPHNKKV